MIEFRIGKTKRRLKAVNKLHRQANTFRDYAWLAGILGADEKSKRCASIAADLELKAAGLISPSNQKLKLAREALLKQAAIYKAFVEKYDDEEITP